MVSVARTVTKLKFINSVETNNVLVTEFKLTVTADEIYLINS